MAGALMLSVALPAWQLAVVAHRWLNDDQVSLVECAAGAPVVLGVHNDKYELRLDMSAEDDDRTIVGLAVDTSSVQVAVADITVGESKADLPPSPVVLVLTMDGCVTAFSLACVDRARYAAPVVHAPLPLPPLPASPAAAASPAPAAPASGGGAWGASFLQANAAAGAAASKAVEEELEKAKGGGGATSGGSGGFSFGTAAAAPFGAVAPTFGVGVATPGFGTGALAFGTGSATAAAFGKGAATTAFGTAAPAFGAGATSFGAAPAAATPNPAMATTVAAVEKPAPVQAKPKPAAVAAAVEDGAAPSWGGALLQQNAMQGALAMKAAEEFMKELKQGPSSSSGGGGGSGFKFGDKVRTELSTRTAVAAVGLVSQQAASSAAAEMEAAVTTEEQHVSPFFFKKVGELCMRSLHDQYAEENTNMHLLSCNSRHGLTAFADTHAVYVGRTADLLQLAAATAATKPAGGDDWEPVVTEAARAAAGVAAVTLQVSCGHNTQTRFRRRSNEGI
jgi:hypothetical protein